MATVSRCVNRVRSSKTFNSRRECVEWAAEQTRLIETPTHKITFGDALSEYLKKESPKKKGERWDAIRINAFLRNDSELCAKLIGDITKADIANWRDRRVKEVSDSTVLREWSLLSSVFNVCINEWGWLTTNPMRGVKKPKNPPPRDRLISAEEIEQMDYVAGYSHDSDLTILTQRAIAAMHFAIETAMRAQEILLLECNDLSWRIAHVKTSKTRAGIRNVPLSIVAMGIIERLRKANGAKKTVFELSKSQLDSLFRKTRNKAGLAGFTFHDSRATAITRLSKKLDILALAKMIGHKNLSLLMVYYRNGAQELVSKPD